MEKTVPIVIGVALAIVVSVVVVAFILASSPSSKPPISSLPPITSYSGSPTVTPVIYPKNIGVSFASTTYISYKNTFEYALGLYDNSPLPLVLKEIYPYPSHYKCQQWNNNSPWRRSNNKHKWYISLCLQFHNLSSFPIC
ncbi:hypothetical protein SJAV_20280 [Sulfurisphaera javensis]|uniref:Sulfocyanin n=1 Tax=Sulfurisphaera javensis TaxID=2049879 RepID=A0AAT9GT43_9CREN